jgi:hypothetical protein
VKLERFELNVRFLSGTFRLQYPQFDRILKAQLWTGIVSKSDFQNLANTLSFQRIEEHTPEGITKDCCFVGHLVLDDIR